MVKRDETLMSLKLAQLRKKKTKCWVIWQWQCPSSIYSLPTFIFILLVLVVNTEVACAVLY